MKDAKKLESTNKTHVKLDSHTEVVKKIKTKIVERGELSHISVDRQLVLVDQLCSFPFGRYILERKGANGFWTDYLISYQNKEEVLPPVGEFILNRSLIVLSHRERFRIYQNLLQNLIKEDVILASIPCGLMRDLLTLNFSKISNYQLYGIDIDEESLALAKNLANDLGIKKINLIQGDAWQLNYQEKFDVITSSGLNVYESCPSKVINLYENFYKALKPGGSLIISVLTYPPGEKQQTDWNLDNISPDDIMMENVVYKDILDLNWRNFRTASEIDKDFKRAGFLNISIYFDKNRIFPTVLAQKPL